MPHLWQANDIKRTLNLSNDKTFETKFWDVTGFHLDPPDRASVLCCDQMSQCQALERTQPGLPMGMGHVRTATHEYGRHGLPPCLLRSVTSTTRSPGRRKPTSPVSRAIKHPYLIAPRTAGRMVMPADLNHEIRPTSNSRWKTISFGRWS